jgi:hypothetical protein
MTDRHFVTGRFGRRGDDGGASDHHCHETEDENESSDDRPYGSHVVLPPLQVYELGLAEAHVHAPVIRFIRIGHRYVTAALLIEPLTPPEWLFKVLYRGAVTGRKTERPAPMSPTARISCLERVVDTGLPKSLARSPRRLTWKPAETNPT